MTTSLVQHPSYFTQSLRTDWSRPRFDVQLKDGNASVTQEGDKATASPATGVRDAIQAVSWTHHPGERGLTLLADTWPKYQMDKDLDKCQEWEQHNHSSKLKIFSSDF